MNDEIEIAVMTYEEDRLQYFTKLMTKTQNKYKRLFKKFKDSPILSAEQEILCDAGRETHFLGDVVEVLEKIACKQSEWISVEDRLPEKDGRYLVALKDGDNYHISTRKFKRSEPPTWWKGHVYGRWSRNTCGVRFWMPLPEEPKMKDGE